MGLLRGRLRNYAAVATVVADSDEVEIQVVESMRTFWLVFCNNILNLAYYINALLNINVNFGGRFFKFLCLTLAARIKEQRKVMDQNL